MCVCGSMCACVCLHCLLTAGETVEGQRAGSWPPASVTLVKVVEQREEVVAGELRHGRKYDLIYTICACFDRSDGL